MISLVLAASLLGHQIAEAAVDYDECGSIWNGKPDKKGVDKRDFKLLKPCGSSLLHRTCEMKDELAHGWWTSIQAAEALNGCSLWLTGANIGIEIKPEHGLKVFDKPLDGITHYECRCKNTNSWLGDMRPGGAWGRRRQSEERNERRLEERSRLVGAQQQDFEAAHVYGDANFDDLALEGNGALFLALQDLEVMTPRTNNNYAEEDGLEAPVNPENGP